jgi:hypothetical protein
VHNWAFNWVTHKLESFFSHPHVPFSPPSMQKISENMFRSFFFFSVNFSKIYTHKNVLRARGVKKKCGGVGREPIVIVTLPTMCIRFTKGKCFGLD